MESGVTSIRRSSNQLIVSIRRSSNQRIEQSANQAISESSREVCTSCGPGAPNCVSQRARRRRGQKPQACSSFPSASRLCVGLSVGSPNTSAR
ncbi:MAG: hypothetical protein EXR75_04835 [Myxococcales bacterium]|nr:hypothetical protein [Myxococcales bacterium]